MHSRLHTTANAGSDQSNTIGMLRAPAPLATMRCGPPDSRVVRSANSRRTCSETARLFSRSHPVVVTDHRGRSLCNFLRSTHRTVWIEGSTGRVRRVLACINPFATAAVVYGVLDLAQQIREVTEAELFALHAWDETGEQLLAHHVSCDSAARSVAVQRETAQRLIDEHLHGAHCDTDDRHRIAVRGDATRVIKRVVEELEIDLVVLGMTSRRRVARALLGCTRDAVRRGDRAR